MEKTKENRSLCCGRRTMLSLHVYTSDVSAEKDKQLTV